MPCVQLQKSSPIRVDITYSPVEREDNVCITVNVPLLTDVYGNGVI